MAGIISFILNRVIQKYMGKRLKAVVNVKQAKKIESFRLVNNVTATYNKPTVAKLSYLD